MLFEVEVDAGAVYLAKEDNEILQATPEPIDRPGRDNVEFVPDYRLVQPIEAGALVAPFAAANPVIDEFADDQQPRRSATAVRACR